MVIPFTGSMEAFREVIFHELVHIFQYDIIYQKTSPLTFIAVNSFTRLQFWFIEGAADYFGEDKRYYRRNGPKGCKPSQLHRPIDPPSRFSCSWTTRLSWVQDGSIRS